MKGILPLLLLFPLLFSQLTVDPSSGSTITSNTFTVSAAYSGPCVLVINGTGLPLEGTKYYGDTSGGQCKATATLNNGTYDFAMYLGSYSSKVSAGPYTLIPNMPGGCKACENLNNTIVSYVFVAKQDSLNRFQVLLVGENSSNISNRFPLPHSAVLVYLHNESHRELVQTVTDGNRTAYINYDPNQCMQYSFMYCCFYKECGFLECIRAFGVKDDYIKAHNIENITDIPLGLGATSYPLDPPKTAFPAIEKVDVCADPNKDALGPALCFPLTLLLGILFTAMNYAGKNPFMGFDISSVKLGRHMKYTPMGVQRGMKISAQTVQGLASQVAAKVKSAKSTQKGSGEGGAKGATKMSFGAALFQSTIKSDLAQFSQLTNLVKGVGGLLKGASSSGGGQTQGKGEPVKSGMSGAEMQRLGVSMGSGGGGSGIVFLILAPIRALLGASADAQQAKKDGKSATWAFAKGFFGKLTGLESIGQGFKGMYQGAQLNSLVLDVNKYNSLRDQFAKANPNAENQTTAKFNEFLGKNGIKGEDNLLYASLFNQQQNAQKNGQGFDAFTELMNLKGISATNQSSLAHLRERQEEIKAKMDESGAFKNLLLIPVGMLAGESALALAGDSLDRLGVKNMYSTFTYGDAERALNDKKFLEKNGQTPIQVYDTKSRKVLGAPGADGKPAESIVLGDKGVRDKIINGEYILTSAGMEALGIKTQPNSEIAKAFSMVSDVSIAKAREIAEAADKELKRHLPKTKEEMKTATSQVDNSVKQIVKASADALEHMDSAIHINNQVFIAVASGAATDKETFTQLMKDQGLIPKDFKGDVVAELKKSGRIAGTEAADVKSLEAVVNSKATIFTNKDDYDSFLKAGKNLSQELSEAKNDYVAYEAIRNFQSANPSMASYLDSTFSNLRTEGDTSAPNPLYVKHTVHPGTLADASVVHEFLAGKADTVITEPSWIADQKYGEVNLQNSANLSATAGILGMSARLPDEVKEMDENQRTLASLAAGAGDVARQANRVAQIEAKAAEVREEEIKKLHEVMGSFVFDYSQFTHQYTPAKKEEYQAKQIDDAGWLAMGNAVKAADDAGKPIEPSAMMKANVAARLKEYTNITGRELDPAKEADQPVYKSTVSKAGTDANMFAISTITGFVGAERIPVVARAGAETPYEPATPKGPASKGTSSFEIKKK
ncbi:Uncharacterised protein [uncultured archaeon]|nr:Uncharacterised protein [uncultured archaeon]